MVRVASACLRVSCLLVLLSAARALPNTIEGMKTTYEVIAEGDGRAVAKGDSVTAHATGTVKETGKNFWSTKDDGQSPFTYEAGVNRVIKGWDQGCLGMKVGGKRKLDIPAAEAYGAGGFPAWGIPPDGSLLFEIEVLEIDPPNW